jgi:four helix bundle protein
MAESIIQGKSFDFAVRIVRLYRYLCDNKEYVISKQMLRSGTSIGANVSEALRGVSRRDFGNKMAIALKEANETEYWLNLLHATDYLDNTQYESIHEDCVEVIKILTPIVKKTLDSPQL